MRILVVDDDHNIANSQAMVFQVQGHEAHVCHDGNQAMEMIERLRPDVVLLDMAMPGMSGLEVADELRQNPDLRPKLLIAVTGFGNDAMRSEILAAGFDLYFLKPVEIHRLKSAIDAIAK